MSDGLSRGQLTALSVTERVTSCLSLVGILFIFATFLLSPYFNKSINRQIFYASIANLCVNIASLVSVDGIAAGDRSALCQFQAFVVQMFLGVDAFWSCCMAWNVYLIFFHRYTVEQLRALDWRYLLGCYGISFVPAFVYLFIDTTGRGKVYGPAIIWCWITPKWEALRMATLYAVVWVAIFLAFTLYCMAARTVWRKRKELPGFLNPLNEDPFKNTVTTEIDVVSCPRENLSASSTRVDEEIPGAGPVPPEDNYDRYLVDVTAEPQEEKRRPSIPAEFKKIRTLTRTAAVNEINGDAWLYARTSFLFFLALLIVWVPSSINRVYALAHPKAVNFGLNYASSLVFPLQGFFNATVYMITSQTACKRLWSDLRDRNAAPRHENVVDSMGGHGKNDVKLDRLARRTSHRLDSDIDSVTSLHGH